MATKTEEIDAAGSGNWTCPAGVTKITVLGVGGGGGGGGGVYDSMSGNKGGGGGGGGGACAVQVYATTPGTPYPYVVGAGGDAGATAGDGGAGGDTTFGTPDDPAGLKALGGSGGLAGGAGGGLGGAPGSGVNTIGLNPIGGGHGGAGSATGGGGAGGQGAYYTDIGTVRIAGGGGRDGGAAVGTAGGVVASGAPGGGQGVAGGIPVDGLGLGGGGGGGGDGGALAAQLGGVGGSGSLTIAYETEAPPRQTVVPGGNPNVVATLYRGSFQAYIGGLLYSQGGGSGTLAGTTNAAAWAATDGSGVSYQLRAWTVVQPSGTVVLTERVAYAYAYIQNDVRRYLLLIDFTDGDGNAWFGWSVGVVVQPTTAGLLADPGTGLYVPAAQLGPVTPPDFQNMTTPGTGPLTEPP